MADSDADETLHFVNGKTNIDHCLQETKVNEKCWRISTLKKTEVPYNTKMRPRDMKNIHFTVLKEKEITGRESRPIRTEAAATKNGNTVQWFEALKEMTN